MGCVGHGLAPKEALRCQVIVQCVCVCAEAPPFGQPCVSLLAPKILFNFPAFRSQFTARPNNQRIRRVENTNGKWRDNRKIDLCEYQLAFPKAQKHSSQSCQQIGHSCIIVI